MLRLVGAVVLTAVASVAAGAAGLFAYVLWAEARDRRELTR